MRIPVVALAVLALIGCATGSGVTLNERGPKPDLKAATGLAHVQLKRLLRDYDSMKGFAVVGGDLAPITATNYAYNFEQAWLLCVEYNAKNAYGAYVGLRQRGFPMRLGSDGEPYIVGDTNWRNYRDGRCA